MPSPAIEEALYEVTPLRQTASRPRRRTWQMSPKRANCCTARNRLRMATLDTRVWPRARRINIASYAGRLQRVQARSGRCPKGSSKPVRNAGILQGTHPRQGRASFPGDEAAVRLRQSPFPGTDEKHCANSHPVRAIEFVDGKTTNTWNRRSTASAGRLLRGK